MPVLRAGIYHLIRCSSRLCAALWASVLPARPVREREPKRTLSPYHTHMLGLPPPAVDVRAFRPMLGPVYAHALPDHAEAGLHDTQAYCEAAYSHRLLLPGALHRLGEGTSGEGPGWPSCPLAASQRRIPVSGPVSEGEGPGMKESYWQWLERHGYHYVLGED